jgi:hypothetical protein
MWKTCFSHFFLLVVLHSEEYKQGVSSMSSGETLHDSTGSRATQPLNTPLLRCTSPAKHTRFWRASETTQQNNKRGSRQAPPFCFSSLNDFISSSCEKPCDDDDACLCDAVGDAGHTMKLRWTFEEQQRM